MSANRGEVERLRRRVEHLEQALGAQRDDRRARLVERRALERDLKLSSQALYESNRDRREELRELSVDLRRIAESRSWRFGHRLMQLVRRVSLRGAMRREGAPEAILDRVERALERLDAGEGSGDGEAGAVRAIPAAARITAAHLDRVADRPPISIVIPIHNAAEELRVCLESVARNTDVPAELVLIDDASTDPAVNPLLEQFGRLDSVRVLRNESNLGFVRTVNRGFASTDGDVVILNSDTEVPPRWLANLALAAYSDETVATVTPLSDNAGAFSAPEIAIENPPPRNVTRDEVGRLVMRGSDRLCPEVPVGGGFCMYIKRAALNEAGDFDAEAFGRGYGEETDFCMRAWRIGWRHVLDDATYVFHQRHASFGPRAADPPSRAIINERYPEYTDRIRDFHRAPDLIGARRNVERAFRGASSVGRRPRLMFALHVGGGGSPQAALDLANALEDRYEPYFFTSDSRTLRISRLRDGELEQLEQAPLEPAWRVTDLSRADYREFAASALVAHDIDLVHARNLIKHTLDLPKVARALSIPVVVSFHDYYLSCPTVHLLDEQLRYCGGVCTPGEGECFTPSELVRGTPPLKHRWVYRWRRAVNEMLECADAFVTTSEHAREVLRGSLFRVRERPLELIEHGRDLDQHDGVAEVPDDGEPVRILVPGNMNVNKGAELIRSLRAEDRSGRLEFHLAGGMRGPFDDLGVVHGPYERGELPDLVRRIRPSFIGTLSITGETYSHVLTEAWSVGVPVLACDIGTFRERIRRHGGGWLLNHHDPAAAYEQILAICGDPDEYRRVAAAATLEGIPSTREMSNRYDLVYRRTRERARAVGTGTADGPARVTRLGREVLRLGMVLVGNEGAHPGSSHVRCLRPLQHPTVRAKVQAVELDPDCLTAGMADCDVVLVQRDAVGRADARALIDDARDAGCAIVHELDDNLLAPDLLNGSPGSDERDVESVRLLAAECDLAVVSTEPLAAAVRRYASNVLVVRNGIDEGLWLGPPDDEPPAQATERDRSIRALYMGTTSHGPDLAMLRSALESLPGPPIELEVVGGEPPGRSQQWYRRLAVPPGETGYPAFVRWLRSNAKRWDLAVAPLCDTPFNRCKSDLKFLEYSALGLPGVYSAAGDVYAEAGDGGARGLLCRQSDRAWIEAITSLRDDAGLRRTLAEAASGYVSGSRRLADASSDYVDALCALATPSRSSIARVSSSTLSRR